MNVKPIIFSAPMVRAILEDRKSMTRRILKNRRGVPLTSNDAWTLRPYRQREWNGKPQTTLGWWNEKNQFALEIPFILPYQVGDILWVRETCMYFDYPADWPCGWGYKADLDYCGQIPVPWDDPNAILRTPKDNWKPSIHMPRWAARIWLEVTGVKVERVQEISEEDAIAEGIAPFESFIGVPEPRAAFAALWDSINAKRGFGWEANPWVEAVTFKRIEKPEGI